MDHQRFLKEAPYKKFLREIGNEVTKAEELQKDDIVAELNVQMTIRLYCVKHVQLEWIPKTFNVPYVELKRPHIGFSLNEGKPTGHYIHTGAPGEPYQDIWHEKPFETEDEMEVFGYTPFTLYRIHHEDYVALGQLINKVLLPSWSIMFQTREGPAKIHNKVAEIQEDIKIAKEAYLRIQEKLGNTFWGNYESLS